MTIRQAERITGLEVRRIPLSLSTRIIVVGAFDHDHEVARAAGGTEKYAAEALVKVIYDRRSRQAMNEQGWRCGQCAKIRPLQCHHIHKRSHGRDDRRENLIALCAPCHEDIERYRVELDPSRDILRAVFEYGLKWGGGQWIRITVLETKVT